MIKDIIKETVIDSVVLSKAAEDFKRTLANKNKLTQRAYSFFISEFLRYNTAVKEFRFTVDCSDKYLKYLVETKKYKPNTSKQYLTATKQFFDFLKSKNLIDKNPFRRVKYITPPPPAEPFFLTKNEINGLLDSIDNKTFQGKRDRALIAMFVFCALSENEISQIKIVDLVKRGRYMYAVFNTHYNNEKTIRMDFEAIPYINEYLTERHKKPGEFLFLTFSNKSKNNNLTVRGIKSIITNRLRNYFGNDASSGKQKPLALRNSSAIYLSITLKKKDEIIRRLGSDSFKKLEKYQNLIGAFLEQ